jgi:hypothetical protein
MAWMVLRRPILRVAGRALTASDRLKPADVIVVTEWDGESGVLTAADLVRDSMAPRVAVLVAPIGPADRELGRRGIVRGGSGPYLVRLLHTLGVAAVETIPTPADGTGSEGDVITAWCDAHQFSSIIVVSSPDHSRRVRRVLHRSMLGHHTKVAVHTTAFSDFDPERWWETHDGVRTEIQGLEKLLVDVVLHPLS